MEGKVLRVAGYRRVSNQEQVDGFSLDAQENNIRQYIEMQGWQLVELYTDAGISVKKDSRRPALERMMHDAEAHRFDVIVVDKVDRFYRHLRGLLSALDQLSNWDISFVSVQERLDFTTVWGKLTLIVLGTLAEIYIDNLGQETKKGKHQRARDGFWNGNIPYGYCRGLCSKCKEPNGEGYCPEFGTADKGNGKIPITHPLESKVVRLVFDWYMSRVESDRRIAEQLQTYPLDESGLLARTRGIPGRCAGGPMQRDAIRNILTNVFYTGFVPFYGKPQKGKSSTPRLKEIFPGKHPAIVSKAEFDSVQEIRKALGPTPRFNHPNESRIYPLSGILHCGHCGRTMRGSTGRGHHYYRDSTRLDRSGNCPQSFVRAEEIEERVVGWLQSILDKKSNHEQEDVQVGRIEKLQQRYDRVKELYIAGQVDKAFYDVEKGKYENLLPPLSKNTLSARMALYDEMCVELGTWNTLSFVQKRRLLRIAAEAVYITGSDLVGIRPSISLLPFTKSLNQVVVRNKGLIGIRTREK